MSYAKRVDSNHAEIAEYFYNKGCTVFDSSRFGFGFPDLVINTPKGKTFIVEIKSDGGELEPKQFWFSIKFRDAWRLVQTIEQAEAVCNE